MMTTGALIQQLLKRDPEGQAQIFIRDETGYYYCEVEKVDGFINGPDAVIHAGGTICTGELWKMKPRATRPGTALTTVTTRWGAAGRSAGTGGTPTCAGIRPSAQLGRGRHSMAGWADSSPGSLVHADADRT